MRINRTGIVFLTAFFLAVIHRTADVYGQGSANRSFSRGGVNVGELSPNVGRKSLQLQQAGLDALRHSDYPTAETLLHQALDLTPSTSAIYNNLAVVCAHRYSLNEAAGWLERARALAPLNPTVTGNLGVIRWLQNRTDESYDLLRKALARGYALTIAHYAMALMALKRQNPLEAVRNLSQVNRKSYPYRDFYLSLALRQLGKDDSATKSFRKFLQENRAPWLLAAYRTQ